MKNLKIYFVESLYQNEKILGRSVKEWMLSEFDGMECQIVKDISEVDFSALPMAVLPLDMPLVTKEYLVRLLENAQNQGVGKVIFGGEDSVFCLVTGRGRVTYFVEDEAFVQFGSAKNCNIVYNSLRKRVIFRLIQ